MGDGKRGATTTSAPAELCGGWGRGTGTSAAVLGRAQEGGTRSVAGLPGGAADEEGTGSLACKEESDGPASEEGGEVWSSVSPKKAASAALEARTGDAAVVTPLDAPSVVLVVVAGPVGGEGREVRFVVLVSESGNTGGISCIEGRSTVTWP